MSNTDPFTWSNKFHRLSYLMSQCHETQKQVYNFRFRDGGKLDVEQHRVTSVGCIKLHFRETASKITRRNPRNQYLQLHVETSNLTWTACYSKSDSSGLWHRVVMWYDTNFPEDLAVSMCTLKMEAARSSETNGCGRVPTFQTTMLPPSAPCRWRQHSPPKRWFMW